MHMLVPDTGVIRQRVRSGADVVSPLSRIEDARAVSLAQEGRSS
jgi:hypothetical protein